MNNQEVKRKPNLKPEIQLLIDIQELDVELQKLKARINTLPQKLAEINASVEEQHKQEVALKRKYEETIKERRRKEMDLKDAEEKKQKYLSQQLSVKTNKEMQALQHEIELIEQKIDNLEDEILKLLDEEEELNTKIHQEKEKTKLVEEKAEAESRKIKEEIEKLKQEYQTLSKKRKEMIAQITDELRDFYNEFHKRYLGELVVPVVNGSCGGCFMQLLPQRLVQIHLGQEIVFCDRCHRLLAYDADYTPESDTQENSHQ